MGKNMSAYIYFTESTVYFTPNAVTLNGHEHVVISAITPAFPRRHQYNTETGRREIATYIPHDFTGKFWVYVAVDHNQRQRYVAKWFRLEIKAENGVITEVVNIMEDYPDGYEPPYIKVRFPSGYWYDMRADWMASAINQ